MAKPNEGGTDVLAEVEERYRKSYAGRLKAARDKQRDMEVALDAERVRAATSREDAARQIAEIKRGSTVNLLEVCGSGILGAGLGVLAQREFDVRYMGVPLMGLLGAAGVGLGVYLKEDFGLRAVFAVGGAMYTAGTVIYALMRPHLTIASETTDPGMA